MSEKIEERFDLLGDPIPENHGKRGRPPHIPTQRNRIKIRLLLADGWTKVRIARALRITKTTLEKHYLVELRQADEARDALIAEHKMQVFEAAQSKNVGAMRLLWQMLQASELDLPGRPQPKRGEKAEPKPGKKEQAMTDAQTAHEDTSWGRLLN